ncbi:MAG: ATP-binding cassette domain-containing protein [Actinomycetota bacterium]
MAERVRVVYGGRELWATPGDIFGRGRYADVVVDETVVSRKHAQLHRGPDGWFVTDLGSANGLYDADGAAAERLDLPAGSSRFSLGPAETGSVIEITIPERMAAPVTARLPRVTPPPLTAPAPAADPDRPDVVYTPAPLASTVSSPPPAPTPQPATVAAPAQAGAFAAGVVASTPVSRSRPTTGVSVRADGVTVVVGKGLTILQPTSLRLPAGSLTAIVGPSGCGKSTLANLLSGRSEPTTGSVAIDGVPMDPSVRTRIGVVPQYDAVHEQLSVRQALRAAARLRLPADTPAEVVDEAVVSTAEILELDDRLDTRIGRLSGGQKKRVSVGYELVSTPVMMVLDEPTSGLDPGLEQDLIDELRALADDGTTTVMVTHSPEAASEADLVIVMAPGGHLTYLGPPSEVLDHFGVDDWPDVFGRLTAETGPQWADYYARSDLYHRHVASPPAGAPGAGAGAGGGVGGGSGAGARLLTGDVERSWGRDMGVMTGRYLRSILSDWKSLGLLAAQAPILGFLFAFVLSQQVFADSLRPRTNAREFVLACVLAMVWIGASNSVREIVKERRTFLRERAVGVAPSALVASRWAVLGLISVIQAVVLYYSATSRQRVPLDEGVLLPNGPIEFMVFLTLIGLAAVGIGLVISGMVRDANKALAGLPIVLIPVILFSGLLIPVAGKAGIEWISWVNPVQWGASGTAVVADVLANEGCNPSGLEAQLQQLLLGGTVSCTNPRWQPTASAQLVNLAGAALAVVALFVLSFVATARSTRSLRG